MRVPFREWLGYQRGAFRVHPGVDVILVVVAMMSCSCVSKKAAITRRVRDERRYEIERSMTIHRALESEIEKRRAAPTVEAASASEK